MGIVEKTQTTTTAVDFDRFRLRRFVESLGDELETVNAPTDLADVAAILEGNPKAVLFRSVGPERAELAGNVAGSRARIARAFGVGPFTWPFGSHSRIETCVPEPPRLPRFPSIEAALAHGPKTFAELMAALGNRDGREIVRAIDALRQKGLARDGEGRYFLKPK
jgi:hypothetical protein